MWRLFMIFNEVLTNHTMTHMLGGDVTILLTAARWTHLSSGGLMASPNLTPANRPSNHTPRC